MNKFLMILALSLISISCDNELDLNEGWKNIPVTYGFLNPKDTAQYIRVEKVFNDPNNSALEVAKIADSLYYNNIEVELINNTTFTKYLLDKIDGNLDGHIRNSGIFSDSPNYLYKIKTSDIILRPKDRFTLIVKKENGDTLTQSSTRLLNDLSIFLPSQSALQRPLKIEYIYKYNVSWRGDSNVGYYDLFLKCHLKEKNKNGEDKWIKKEIDWKIATGLTNTKYKYYGKDFFIFLQNTLKADDNIEREFISYDLIVRAVGKELKNYTDILNSNLGITSSQQIPTYTNMSNGFGVFTSLNSTEMNGFYLSQATLDTLRTGIYTKGLNFK